nr:DNA repair protein RecO [uncultured Solibaculum sp.]
MLLSTNGLIIRQQNIGEADRVVSVLTQDRGVIRAFANGARRVKNKNMAATSLFSYSRLTLYHGRDKYTINDAESIQVFFDLRRDVERLALGQYFCELCLCLAPQEEEAEAFLRLTLNCLHLLCAGKRPLPQIKATYELRMLGMAGYMPDLVACSECGAYESEGMFLSLLDGTLRCVRCQEQNPVSPALALNKSVLAAMRHILYADQKKVFSFTLPDGAMKSLGRSVERFLLSQLDRSFQTLTFYHTLSMDPE